MKTLSTLALLAAIMIPSVSYAACGVCPAPAPTCAPVCDPAPVTCMRPVMEKCICCPKIRGFWG